MSPHVKDVVLLVVVVWIIAGLLLTYRGALSRSLKAELFATRMMSAVCALGRERRFPDFRPGLYEFILRASIVLLWPVFLPGVMREERRERRERDEPDTTLAPTGVKFTFGTGKGDIRCHDCGYAEEVTFFLHGAGAWSITGFQCAECGRFEAIENARLDPRTGIAETPCECGGVLHRERMVFCPRCRSERLSYFCSLIT